MRKLTAGIFFGVLIVGGTVAWGLVPKSWFELLPPVVQIGLVACAVLFSLTMFIGYALDTGIPQKIFKRK